jgi:YedE family putative selenium metabolism protein
MVVAGRFHLGFDGQPIAHRDGAWNALAMVLVGLTGAFAGGCPVRQMVMSGEGNGDAFVTTAGIVVGAAIAHNFGMVSSPAGPTVAGRTAVMVGIVYALIYAVAIVQSVRSGARRAGSGTGAPPSP